MLTSPCIVGIEIEPAALDVGVWPSHEQWRVSRDARGIAELVEQIRALQPSAVLLSVDDATLRHVLEETGVQGVRPHGVDARKMQVFARANGTRGGLAIACQAAAQRDVRFCLADGTPIPGIVELSDEQGAVLSLLWCRFCVEGWVVRPSIATHELYAATIGLSPEGDRLVLREATLEVSTATLVQRLLDDVCLTPDSEWQLREEAPPA